MEPSHDTRLKRLNTNESAQDSIFSRQGSSTSVATSGLACSGLLNKSLSFTKIHDDTPTPTPSSHGALSMDSLAQALAQAVPHSGVPKSANNLTTTPTNEPAVLPKWCIILVGLPACGKSSICKKLIADTQSFFQQNELIDDFKIDSFNAGNFRRKLSDFKTQTHDFFNFNNAEAKNQRETFAHIALEHLLNSLINSQINVGIFDATNSTKERREYIFNTIKEKEEKSHTKINTLILHVKCTDQRLWRFNVEGKTTGPDYINQDHDAAIADFIHRSELYTAAFEDITMEELSTCKGSIYVEVDNAGKDTRIETNGYKDDDNLVYPELIDFVNTYYDNYGFDYEQKVNEFWEKKA